MLTIGLTVIGITAFALLLQEKAKIPLPITLLTTAIGSKMLGITLIDVNDTQFDQVLLLLLPILLTVDILPLKLSDLKSNALSLTFVAFVAVVLSIAAGVALHIFILPGYALSIPAMVALFCMVLATDPVTVAAVFKNFKVPHKLKIIAEGESLFNDATALVIFSIAISFMGTSTDVVNISWHSFLVVFGAIAVGLISGFIGLFLISLSKDPVIETAFLITTALGSFLAAEHMHWSGILAVVVSILTANHIIIQRIYGDTKIIHQAEKEAKGAKHFILSSLENAVVDKANHEMIGLYFNFLAVIAAVILFLSLGDLIALENLLRYWKEITAVFIATTVIRLAMMSKFAWISNQTVKMQNISVHWWMVLSAAGVKGALSVLMLHLLPADFSHKSLFEAIVIGNILLTTFIYPVALILIFKIKKETFSDECANEH